MQKFGPHKPPGAARYLDDPTVSFKVGYLSKQPVLINNAHVGFVVVIPTCNQPAGNYLHDSVNYLYLFPVSGRAAGHYVSQADVAHSRRLKHQTVPAMKGALHTSTTVVSDHIFPSID